jgi:hypothetical protein
MAQLVHHDMLSATVSTARRVGLSGRQSRRACCAIRDRRAPARAPSSGNVRPLRSVFGSPSTTVVLTITLVSLTVIVLASRSMSY